MDEILRLEPTVFAVDDTYQIFIPVNCQVLMWVRIGKECYYNHSNGVMRSNVTVHKIVVPAEELNKEKKYTICCRKIIERKPYYTETEDEIQKSYDFYPVEGDSVRTYHISDAHVLCEQPIEAAKTYERAFGEIDFLILNGDIIESSQRIESFDRIYKICGEITHGNKPVVFSRGNHDTRGIYAENLAEYTPCNNGISYYPVRLGKFWAIVMDCGEDKPDERIEYGHTICCHSFRKEETKYLEKLIAENKQSGGAYNDESIKYKAVIAHNPFTWLNTPPFDIEKELYSYWAKLLNDEIKPHIMLCGHLHKLEINKKGGDADHLGQPCDVIIGSVPDYERKYFAGVGLYFSPQGIEVAFTDSDGKILREEKM